MDKYRWRTNKPLIARSPNLYSITHMIVTGLIIARGRKVNESGTSDLLGVGDMFYFPALPAETPRLEIVGFARLSRDIEQNPVFRFEIVDPAGTVLLRTPDVPFVIPRVPDRPPSLIFGYVLKPITCAVPGEYLVHLYVNGEAAKESSLHVRLGSRPNPQPKHVVTEPVVG
ncbi:MAG TPA: hypothetical protein VNO75_09370 [Gemmatimonadaceae bacterium]|nr:hypothetical protein [Gemmatimonadaceae bacterium]